MAKKILMLVGDYAEDYETMVPFQALQMVGHTVHAVCPGKKAGEKIRTAIHDFEGDQTYSEKRGHDFAVNASFDGIDASTYDALVIAGGRAPEYLRYDADLLRLVRWFNDKNLPIASVCHGIEIITAADIGRGRTATTVAKCKLDVEQGGGTYVDREVVVDGNLVTARTWHDNPAWMREFLKLLDKAV